MSIKLNLSAILLIAFGSIGICDASEPGKNIEATPQKVTLSAKQRGDLARSIVRKWAPAVQNQGGSVNEWALKIGRFVGTADAINVQQAAAMPTYQSMMGVLQGQPAASESIQKAVASGGQITAALLGSTIADTTYTPLPNGRCRIADSRVINSMTSPSVVRGIDVEDTTSYTSQGGSGSTAGDGAVNCGIPSFATSFAISVTVLPPPGQEGIFKVFQNGSSYTTGNTVFFTNGTSGTTSDLIVRSCQSCALELSIFSNAQTHYVLDVIGYFMPPEATALQCLETAEDITPAPGVAAGDTDNRFAPACPAGYTQTATNCKATSFLMPIVYSAGGTCSARNNSSGVQYLKASRTCCRVPGR